ncbi:MAG: hypothetical protein ACQGVK_19275 [Myxococcota bacterium]
MALQRWNLTLISILLLGTVTSGCLSFSQHRLGDIGMLPQPTTGKKPTIALDVKVFRDQGNGVEDVGSAGDAQMERLIRADLDRSGLFSTVLPAGYQSDLRADMEIVNRYRKSTARGVLTLATLALVPTVRSDHFEVTTRFKDAEGNTVGTIVKAESRSTWVHLFLLVPALFSSDWTAIGEVMGEIVDSTLIEADAHGLLQGTRRS